MRSTAARTASSSARSSATPPGLGLVRARRPRSSRRPGSRAPRAAATASSRRRRHALGDERDAVRTEQRAHLLGRQPGVVARGEARDATSVSARRRGRCRRARRGRRRAGAATRRASAACAERPGGRLRVVEASPRPTRDAATTRGSLVGDERGEHRLVGCRAASTTADDRLRDLLGTGDHRRHEEHDHRVDAGVGEHVRNARPRTWRRSPSRACRPGSRGSPRAAGAPPARARVSSRELGQLEPGRLHRRRRRGSRARPRSSARRRGARGEAAGDERSTAASASSSSVSASITPAWRNSASTAAVEPASAAVCEPAARCPAPRAAALHREDRLLARDPAGEPRRTCAGCRTTRGRAGRGRSSGSSSQYSSRSFDETSALLPIETNAERPSPRAAPRSSSARPSAPLCDEKPMLPGGNVRGAKVAFSPGRRREDAEAVRADQPRAVRAHEREQLVLATAPSLPVSAKPAEITQSARVPFAQRGLGLRRAPTRPGGR